jgi:hypothetical protein
MLRLHTAALMVACLAVPACQKSAEDHASEAAKEQKKAEEVARDASNDLNREVVKANEEAAKKVSDAEREAKARVAEAQRDGAEKVADAQKGADEASSDAVKAFQAARTDLRKSVETELESIDERVGELKKKLGKAEPAVQNQVAPQVTAVEQKTKTLRSDLRAFETQTAASVDEFRVRLERSMIELKKKLDEIDKRV